MDREHETEQRGIIFTYKKTEKSEIQKSIEAKRTGRRIETNKCLLVHDQNL